MKHVVDRDQCCLTEDVSASHHVAEGRDSGYPWCCIVAYFFKTKLIPKWLCRLLPRISKQEHVYCPFHIIYHLIVAPKYFYCHNCHWSQYRKPECNKCKRCKHTFHFIGDLYLCKECGYIKQPTYIEYDGDTVIQHYDTHERGVK